MWDFQVKMGEILTFVNFMKNNRLVVIFRQKFSKKAILAVDKKWSHDIIDMNIR